MVERFEVGKKYRVVGVPEEERWHFVGVMAIMLDGIPRECVVGKGVYALFEDMYPNTTGKIPFNWGTLMEYFEEVK